MTRWIRRRLRFRLRTLLLAMAVVAFVCWWVHWPYVTAQKFVAATAKVERDTHQPSGYWFPRHDEDGFRTMVNDSSGNIIITQHSRDFYDILLARCTFIAHGKEGGCFRFWVSRGKVVGGAHSSLLLRRAGIHA